ncbi:uncharacterized protein LOC125065214 [Vanessa atalanta]|uniref:uncharacterized protein LOC125065214 n=1 Tax=Vanessa atalanta TaxID=42275 RepID=UPI001FCDCDA3|nr:uncharacterized protein LOC125065214 [Vanessa atalanta]
MEFFHRLWTKSTQCKALEQSSGKLETLFFESVYRVTYFAGWALLDNTLKYRIYSGILKLAVGFLISCEAWHLVSKSTSLDGIIDNVNVTLMHFIALYRYQNMRANKTIYKKLASAMESPYFDTSTPRRQEMVRFWSQRNERFLKLLLLLGSCTLAAWHIYPLVDDIDYNLMVSARFPFEYQTPIRFPIFYIIVLITFNYASLFVMVNDLIMQAHLMHLLCQYTVLGDCFEGIIDDCIGDKNSKNLQIYPIMDDLEYNLMVSVRLPFDYRTPVLYTITYISTLIVFSLICYFVMTNDLIVQAHLMHLLCQFSILNDCFKNILNDCQSNFKDIDTNNLHLNKEFTRVYKSRLGNLVDQHTLILLNTLKLRDLMSIPMLIQLATSTTLICSISFQVTTSVDVNMTKGLMSLFYLGYNMFVLYIICRWCEEIKIQSQSISEAVYCSGWENGIVMAPGVRTSILLILARAHKPTGLSAGGMYDLSLEAYANIVKTSYSALTVLLQLR